MSNEEIILRFKDCVDQMIKHDIHLPDDFLLHYVVTEYRDRDGVRISAKPYLTKEIADNKCDHKERKETGTRYWWTETETVVSSISSGQMSYNTGF